jgi:hypothetical protein
VTAHFRARAALLISFFALNLAACGGGGGDDDEEDAPEVADQDASGVWLGTFTTAGTTTARPFRMIAAPSGAFAGTIGATNATSGDGRLVVGTGDVTANIVTGSGTAFAPTGPQTATVTNGRVTERASMSGTYTDGGQSGTFSLTYLSLSSRASSLTAVAGTYSQFPAPPAGQVTATLTVTTGGVLTFATSNGCNGSGTVTPIAGLNEYSWTMSLAACPIYSAGADLTGLAYLDDVPNGGTGKLFVAYGSNAARTLPFGFAGSNP